MGQGVSWQFQIFAVRLGIKGNKPFPLIKHQYGFHRIFKMPEIILFYCFTSLAELGAVSHTHTQQRRIQVFPDGGGNPKRRAATYDLAEFHEKLHKNEENWIEGARVQNFTFYYVGPPLHARTHAYTHTHTHTTIKYSNGQLYQM